MEEEKTPKELDQKTKTLIAQEKAMNSVSKYLDLLYWLTIAGLVIGVFSVLSIYA